MIKPNLEGIETARRAARNGRVDRGAGDPATVAKAKPNSHKFATIDDAYPESSPEHYVHPVMDGTAVKATWVDKALEANKGNHDVAAHLQGLQDDLNRHDSNAMGHYYSRALIATNSGETFAASRDEGHAGLPDKVNGKPVVYRWKEVLPAGAALPDKKGVVHNYSRERIAKMVDTFSRAISNGFVAPLPERHREPNGDLIGKNYGFVVGAKQDPQTGNLFLHNQIFADNLDDAMTKYSSICVAGKSKSNAGEFTDLIDHNAIVADPQIAGLGEFTESLAASRGDGYAEFDVVEFGSRSSGTRIETSGASDMNITELRDSMGDAAKSLGDQQVIDLARDRVKLLAKAEADLKASRAENSTLQASRGVASTPSDGERSGFGYGIVAKFDAISPSKTGISPAVLTQLKSLLVKDGKANVFAMSRGDGDTDPIGVKVADILATNVVPPEYGSETKAIVYSRTGDLDETDYEKQEKEGRDQGKASVEDQVKHRR